MSAIWDHRTSDLGDLRVHYLQTGSGPPLVLLHGGLATAEMSWNTPLSLLAEDFQLVAPDTRAHGGTNHPGGELSYPQFADDLAAFLDAVGIDRPVLIGHSDGGQTALEFGLRYPGRAAGLVLSGTMSEPTADYLAGIRRWGFTGPGDVDIDRIIADFGDDLEPMRAAHGRAGDDAGWLEYLQQISTLWHTVPSYTADQLGGVTDPTLVITGDRDELADLDQARRLFDGLPGAQLGVVPGAGHGAADEAIFWQLVRRFVDGLG